MKIFTLLAFTIATSAAHAQVDPEYLKTKALSFGFNGSNNVGGKIWISDQHALTLSVSGATTSSIGEAADTSEIDDESRNSSAGVMVGVEQHLDWGLGFSPFLAGGLSVGYSQYSSRSGTTTTQYENESNATNLGLHLGVGIEYWLARRVSIAGVQRVTGSFQLGESSYGVAGSSTTDQNTRSFSLGLGTTSLTLSLYL